MPYNIKSNNWYSDIEIETLAVLYTRIVFLQIFWNSYDVTQISNKILELTFTIALHNGVAFDVRCLAWITGKII